MEDDGIVEASKILSGPEVARRIFKQELKPTLDVSQKAQIFGRVLGEYNSSLQSIVLESKLDEEIVAAASNVVKIQQLKGSKNADETKTEDLAIRQLSKEVFSFFNKYSSGTTALLSSYLGGDSEKEGHLQELIGENLSRFINIRKGLGKLFREDLQKREIEKMAKFLLVNSRELRDVERNLDTQGDTDILEQLDNFYISSESKKEILELNESVKVFGLRDWIRTTVKEAKRGRKIYETPFYRSLLDELHFQSRRKNGVGGLILYGPPGTGKTEILQEKNKQQGFRTRVINIHHYTSFGDLIGEKAIQLGTDPTASTAQKLKAVINVFGDESPENFAIDIQNLFTQLQQEGKLPQQENIFDFLSTFVSQETRNSLNPDSPSSWDWKTIKEEFVGRQRTRMLRTTLASPYQESVEDIVKGEILLAIQNGERVVLDELDKAGPNSMGGILSFLAKSPGETFEYGQSTVTIPSWFIVDATSNSLELNEYLKDRFSDLEVGTPPIKDQLMIAGVRLSDDEGNILLTDYEQRQLVGFFVYMVPNINKILTSHDLPPMSNRRILELTSYLVNFRTLQRTNVSFGDAVKRLFERNKTWITNKEAAEQLDGLLKNSKNILQDKPRDFREEETLGSPTTLTRREKYNKALKNIVISPLIVAINGLMPQEAGVTSGTHIAKITLSEKQRNYVNDWLDIKDPKKAVRGDVRQLPIGFTVQEEASDQSPSLRIASFPEYAPSHIILTQKILKNGRIAATSDDGTIIAVVQDNPQGSNHQPNIEIVNTYKAPGTNNERISIDKESEISIDRKGNYLLSLNSSSNKLSIYTTTNPLESPTHVDSVKRFEISPNGKLLLKESLNGETELVAVDSLASVALLPGNSWSFAGERMLIQKNEKETVGEKAFFIF